MKNQCIKFRVWNNTLKTFYKPEEIAVTGDGMILVYDWHDDYGKSWGHEWYNNESVYDIEQSSGLKDKNGFEIYEGDIVYFDGWEYPSHYVTFNCHSFCFKGRGGIFTFLDILNRGNITTIVGNIHENPELIK